MKESDLFHAYGMDHDAPIRETTRCATPRCGGEVIARGRTIFCTRCMDRMRARTKRKPDG